MNSLLRRSIGAGLGVLAIGVLSELLRAVDDAIVELGDEPDLGRHLDGAP